MLGGKMKKPNQLRYTDVSYSREIEEQPLITIKLRKCGAGLACTRQHVLSQRLVLQLKLTPQSPCPTCCPSYYNIKKKDKTHE